MVKVLLEFGTLDRMVWSLIDSTLLQAETHQVDDITVHQPA